MTTAAPKKRIHSAAKGKRGERELNRMLKESFPEYAPHLKRNKDQDAVGGDDIRGLPGYSVECKNVADRQWSLRAFWAQTCRQAGPGEVPVLFRKLPLRGWRVYISLADLNPRECAAVDRCDLEYVVVLSYAAFVHHARLRYAATP